MLIRGAIVFAVALIMMGPASAANLYSGKEIADAHRAMAPNIRLMVTEDNVRTAPRTHRPAAAKVTVKFVDRGPHPLAFWAIPATATVYVPMESVRFIDDLAIVYAWFEKHGCGAEQIQTYLWALLREQRPLPAPLTAFGIDRSAALADSYVNDVSGKVLKSSILFIMAHEVGHIVLRHRGGLEGAASRQQEIEADSFALDHFAAIGATPAGIAIYFLAVRWHDPLAAAASYGTHPVSPQRIDSIAERMAANPDAFSFAEPYRQLGRAQAFSMANDLRTIARLSSDDGMLTILPKELARAFPLSRLQAACPG